MIKAIIFDCFGVLTKDLWHEFTSSLPPDQAGPARELNRAYDSGIISKEEFLQQVYEVTNRKPELVEELLDTSSAKNTELLSHIQTLKSKYKIGLLSNIATPWIRESFLTKEEQALFDDMIFSYEVRMAKPDPRIFELACERLGVELSEAVMIDDIEGYCAAAGNLGMKSIQYVGLDAMKQKLEQILSA